MDAGTIAVIASVLVLAYQARSLATHARIANEVAGAEANRELLTWWHDSVLRVFVEYPETRALLYDASVQPADAAQQVRLQVVSEMAADALQVALETAGRLAPFTRYQEPWKEYAAAQVASSSAIRSVVRGMPNAWAALAPLVEAYDHANPPIPELRDEGAAPGEA